MDDMDDMDDTGAHKRVILRERARRLAQVQEQIQRHAHGQEVVVVGVGDERFGIDAATMSGVVPTPSIAALPGLPAWMLGIVQVRGVVLSVVSIARCFEVADGGDARYLAIIEGDRGALGLLVDRVLGFRRVGADDLAAGFGASASSTRPIRGVTTDLLALIDVDAVIARADLTTQLTKQLAADLAPERGAGAGS